MAEVAGAAMALRQHMTPIRTSRTELLDTCGTGGDGCGTFNISTAAALVAAAAGVAVAKHGNRAATSRSGSADVLAALGVNVEADVACVEACLEELGICFCFAPLLHQAMRHVAAVRKRLGMPTIFNILGPLANPAGAPLQLLGVGRANCSRCWPRPWSCWAPGGAWSSTAATAWTKSPSAVRPRWSRCRRRAAAILLDAGRFRPACRRPHGTRSGRAGPECRDHPRRARRPPGPARDIVVANAAAALLLAGKHPSPPAVRRLAAEAIDSGAAAGLLARLVERTRVA